MLPQEDANIGANVQCVQHTPHNQGRNHVRLKIISKFLQGIITESQINVPFAQCTSYNSASLKGNCVFRQDIASESGINVHCAQCDSDILIG